MATLCFGGSFNPVHHGHLLCARAAAEHGGYQQVLLIPTGISPHKPGHAEMASGEDRLKMCRLATNGDPLFGVSDIEFQRAGPSYTIQTARELAGRGLGPVHWLIGADMLLFLPQWKDPESLLREVRFVVMARPGWTLDWDTLPEPFRHLRQHVVEVPQIDISATEIRRRVARNLSVQYLTPPPVCDYIRARGLYAPPPPPFVAPSTRPPQ